MPRQSTSQAPPPTPPRPRAAAGRSSRTGRSRAAPRGPRRRRAARRAPSGTPQQDRALRRADRPPQHAPGRGSARHAQGTHAPSRLPTPPPRSAPEYRRAPAGGRLFDRPQDRIDRRERIVRHLRPGVSKARQERRLARVRQPHEVRRRRAGATEARSTPPRPKAPSRQTEAPAGSRSRTACSRARPHRRPRPQPAAPAPPGRRTSRRSLQPTCRAEPESRACPHAHHAAEPPRHAAPARP